MFRFKRNPSRVAPLAFNAMLLAGCALGLSACATLPAPQMSAVSRTDVATGAASQAAVVAGDHGVWPVSSWWRDYHDPQLTALIEAALADAPDMRAAAARAMKAQAASSMTRASQLPTLGATAGAQLAQQSGSMGLPLPPGWDDNGRVSLDLNWEIDFWGKNRAAYSAALSDARAAQAERAHAALVLSTAVAGQYAQLSGLYADHDAAREAVVVRTRTLDLMDQRYKSGLENAGAVARVKSAQASAQGDVVAIEEAMALTRYRIAALLGAGPDRGEQITRPAALGRGGAALPAQLPIELIGRRPDVAAARLRIQSAQRRILVAERSFYPNVNLSAFVGLSSLNLSNLLNADSFVGSAGPAVSLPIFQGGRLRANYRMSEADFELAVAQYDGTLSHALGEVAGAVKSLSALNARRTYARNAYDAAHAAWTVANNRYRGGLATYLDVLSAEDALIATRRASAALEARALALDIELIRSLGGGYQDLKD